MNLTRTALQNPASVIVIAILILLFGIISLLKMPIQITPDIEQPQISVFTGWRSAAPQEVETVIIEPIENAIKNTRGVIKVETNIQRGFGSVTLTFDVGADMQQAMLDVLNNLNQAPPLPLDAIEPTVVAGGGQNTPNAASILIRPLPGNHIQDVAQYQQLIEDVVYPRLSRIQGVGQVNLNSQRPRELRITFDAQRAAALGLSISNIAAQVRGATDASGGFADVGRRQYTVRFAGQFTPQSLLEMIVGYSGERPVYLSDIASAEVSFSDRNGFTLRNGAHAYYITIARNNDANTVALLDDINQAITELNQGELLEAGLMMDLSFDASVHIRNALALVKSNLGLGVLLALGLLWLFMRGWRATAIIALSIPLSLAIALLALQLLGRSLNVISLAGLAFAVGLVLDAAIIVQENILRLKSEGLDDKKAALRGAAQVSGALLASTATTVAIFLPILFMAGIEGQLFSDLALTLSVAVCSSFVVAITVIPLASRYWLGHAQLQDPFAGYWQRLTALLMRLTNTNIKRLSWVSGLLLASVVVTLSFLPRTDFMPRAPIDGFFFSFSLPPGGNIDFIEQELANRVVERLEPYYSGGKTPAIKSYNFYTFGPNASGGFVYAADPTAVEQLMNVVRNEVFAGIPDTQVFLFRGSMINVAGGGDGRSVELNLQGADLAALQQVAAIGIASVQQHLAGGSAQPVPALEMAEPELQLLPYDRAISQAGLNRAEVANAVRAFTSGLFVSEYFDGNDRMNVILRAEPWQSPEQLAAMPLLTPRAGVQALDSLVQVRQTVGPSQLRRIGGKRTVSLIVRPPEGMSLDETMDILTRQVMPAMQQALPPGASLLLSGNASQMNSAIDEMLLNFGLALLILLLLMTALFRSLRDALLVLLVMPLAIAGGVLALAAVNLFSVQSLDLLTMIGFIILLGLVVNNAILLVDQTRSAERDGLSRQDAVQQAILVRARPVYMSTLTSLFGMLPLMLIPGVGAEIYRGLATVIVGGMAISALFTLILLPAVLQLQRPAAVRAQANTALTKGHHHA
ncbi:MAG: efflux RND transporter permease subunit [Gammaproteobacteria bacterium]|nr:efflux RND transporter permease subunit [Gammaproteobacteria bacterium]MBU1553257.1 efflux RND transporter permease subunit [Gammaproteobacteria bacterium]MBU2069004.1 efflux RND transporter permease subunit [Gammaproteobacteria bacterium]MBU2183227.1 efflux RND transporter permease subunit [Gammaproteobacteria bacterium]MBU2204607.1 efflux RND transporter permease subunit [Gammaproteobacteria bacterium]